MNFVKRSDNKVVATISPIYVYDSFTGDVLEGETHYTYANELNYRKLAEGKYEITITVDQEFLSNPVTVYPVYVDPSAAVVAGSGSSKGIRDNPIYNGSSGRYAQSGANVTGVIGYVNSSYGAGRMLMSFPGLMEKDFMKSSNYTVTSALLSLYDESGQSKEATISAYESTGPIWNESSVYSSDIWNGIGPYIDSQTFSYPSSVGREFNLTSIVREWQEYIVEGPKNSLANPNKGIILKNGNETSTTYHKCIKTTENSRKPYLSIKYVYNGCKGARNIKDMALNCQEYAFFVPNSAGTAFDNMLSDLKSDVSDGGDVSVEEALSVTKNCMKVWLNNTFGTNRWREAASYDAEVGSDEWMVCMRVGVYEYGDKASYDYHFWYRADTGVWFHKPGTELSSRVLHMYNGGKRVIDPSTEEIVDGWARGDVDKFYNSDTVYYVVKSKSGGGIGYEQK